MRQYRKESKQIYCSVEGINCETLYLNHLQKIINTSGLNTFNIKIVSKVSNPISFAKTFGYRKIDTYGNRKKIPFIHIQDIEDACDLNQLNKFKNTISELRYSEKEHNINYILGYSNYTFELWMLLHVADMQTQVQNRKEYLKYINKYFHKNFRKIDEYKAEKAFQQILDEYVTFNSICEAIKRAEKIVSINKAQNKKHENFKGEIFYANCNNKLDTHQATPLR